MPTQRNLNLLDYDISENKYKELKYFCLQYQEKKEKLEELCEISSIKYDNIAKTKNCTSIVENISNKKLSLENDISIIEKAAFMADEDLYEYLIKNITCGVKYQYLDIPISRAAFYRKKKEFFKILSQLKK